MKGEIDDLVIGDVTAMRYEEAVLLTVGGWEEDSLVWFYFFKPQPSDFRL
jgi:hypothetical protein